MLARKVNFVITFVTLSLYENGLEDSYEVTFFNSIMRILIMQKCIVFGDCNKLKVQKFFYVPVSFGIYGSIHQILLHRSLLGFTVLLIFQNSFAYGFIFRGVELSTTATTFFSGLPLC